MPSHADKIVDGFTIPREAREEMVRAVPDEVVRGIVSDWVKPAAPGEPNKSLIEKLVERFGD
jgi:hypothetical protein